MSNKIDLVIDVTGVAALPGPLHIAATVHLPDPIRLVHTPIVIFAAPGGGYARRYFDLAILGHTDYSQAKHHIERGLILVAYDHLGVGESSVTGLDVMTIEMIAAANDQAVRKIADLLGEGAIDRDFPAVPGATRIGIGQSMGGGVTMIMQGRHRTFDAIASLGYSAIHTRRGSHTAEMLAHSRTTDPRSLSAGASSAKIQEQRRHDYHWDDVPEDIVAVDMAEPPPRKNPPPWGSSTIPNCGFAMLSPGYVKEEAATIDVPVLCAMGERDVVPDPHAEPSAFRRSRDISICVIPRMAHMHNFASTRTLLWDRIAGWCRLVTA